MSIELKLTKRVNVAGDFDKTVTPSIQEINILSFLAFPKATN